MQGTIKFAILGTWFLMNW